MAIYSKNIKAPKLRFPQFKDDWSHINLSNIIEERSEYPSTSLPLYSLTIENGVVPKTERYERSFLVKSKDDSYKVMHFNDFGYNPMNLRFGALACHKEQKKVLVSKYYNIFSCNEGVLPYFLEPYLTSPGLIRFYNKMSTGSLEEKKRVHFSDFLNFQIPMPSIDEQEEIASFLTIIDEKINVLQQKITLINNYKKGLMQILFTHKVRFSDGDSSYDDWETKKLGQVLIKNSKKNKTNQFTNVQSVSNTRGFVDQTDLFSNRVIASKDLSNYYVIERGTFAYNPSRIDVGSLAYKTDDKVSVVSPLYVSFTANKDYLEDKFLLSWLKSPEFIKQMHNSFEGSVRNTLSYDSLARMKINLPPKHEQKKMADFLTALDYKKELEDNKLEQIKQFRKALLERMFI